MRTPMIIITLLSVIAIFISCSRQSTIVGGGGSEVEVVGRILFSSGDPASHTLVKLIPQNYNAVKMGTVGDSLIDTSDDSGNYKFKGVAPGRYNVQGVHLVQRTRVLVTDIQVDQNEKTQIPPGILLKSGSISLLLPGSGTYQHGYAYIPGTEIVAYPKDNSSKVLFDSVPAGIMPEVRFVTTGDSTPVVKLNVQVEPGDTVTIANPSWNYMRQLRLNTSASGANITKDLYDFPILIRLNETNFEFNQALNDGADVRFSKMDATPLPFEIERWDAGKRKAEIWVKVDTIYGNDSTQTIMMYWGNRAAASASNDVAVFDTGNSFDGVWHLNETGDIIHDITVNIFNGNNNGSTPVTGLIGGAREFLNGNNIKISGQLHSPSNITLSAWVSSDSSGRTPNSNIGQEIISIGDAAALRLDDSYGIGTCGWYHSSFVNDTSFATTKSGRYLTNTGWHYIAFSINTITHIQVLYIDGIQCAISNDTNSINYSGLGTDTYIGIHGNGEKVYNFSGQIDEVRVNNISLDSDWIKLCFMNQKEQDALVKW